MLVVSITRAFTFRAAAAPHAQPVGWAALGRCGLSVLSVGFRCLFDAPENILDDGVDVGTGTIGLGVAVDTCGRRDETLGKSIGLLCCVAADSLVAGCKLAQVRPAADAAECERARDIEMCMRTHMATAAAMR
jgi:hypothetical protein